MNMGCSRELLHSVLQASSAHCHRGVRPHPNSDNWGKTVTAMLAYQQLVWIESQEGCVAKRADIPISVWGETIVHHATGRSIDAVLSTSRA